MLPHLVVVETLSGIDVMPASFMKSVCIVPAAVTVTLAPLPELAV